MAGPILALMLVQAMATVHDRQDGPWRIATTCSHGFDSFGCVTSMRQDTPTIHVNLLFRGKFEMRASLESCAEGLTELSFAVDQARWRKTRAAVRATRLRGYLEAWSNASLEGCGALPELSLDDFEAIYTRAATEADNAK
jgi:hypothetical protein